MTSIVSHHLPINTAPLSGPPSSFVVLRQSPSLLAFPQSFLPMKAYEVTLDLNLCYFDIQNLPKPSHHTWNKSQNSSCGWIWALSATLTSWPPSPGGSSCPSHTFLPVPQMPQIHSHLGDLEICIYVSWNSLYRWVQGSLPLFVQLLLTHHCDDPSWDASSAHHLQILALLCSSLHLLLLSIFHIYVYVYCLSLSPKCKLHQGRGFYQFCL